MKYSKFGIKFSSENGITRLMDDLGSANHSNDTDIVMLGGGNPAPINQLNEIFIKEITKLIDKSEIASVIGRYDSPRGNAEFIKALSIMFNKHYKWDIDESNIVITNGSQNSFFSLFNLLAGEMQDGSSRKILLPIVPEYIGYADQGLTEDIFVSIQPDIVFLDNKQYKYQINFDKLKSTIKQNNIGAICVSRPTNPTGNVITDIELKELTTIAQDNSIPLIVDNAYGQPFPDALYTNANLDWNNNIVLCMSLSKLGLPGLRTGIVIANREIAQALSRINGVLTLAPNSMGPGILTRMIQDDELLQVCSDVIKPFYKQKADNAVTIFNEVFTDFPVYMHKLEGAFFMWLWFPELKITSEQLYIELKKKNVYIIPGHNFFMGMESDWDHQNQCIRINCAKDEDVLRKGLEIILKTVT
ncbi:MAG: valine--pyruvate transaminase [Gammaproteobacteria bacterium]|nr:valine--pyruvate transaminase [Gammaproteobacteria bacterium]